MKAPSSDASVDDGADPYQLDYEDLFSVLMYYGHMSKQEIMKSSRPFLYGIYRSYVKRACENLGVPPNGGDCTDSNTPLSESDYPTEFGKMSRKEREEAANKYSSDEDFLSRFAGFNRNKFVNDKTFADRREIHI